MRPELQLILDSVLFQSNEANLRTLDEIIIEIKDWNYFTSQLIERGLAPLFYKKLPQLANLHIVPTHVQSKLRGAYYKTVSRSMMLYGALNKVLQEFNKAGIQVIALKGIYLSEHLYGDIGLRLMSDIDLLVRDEDGLACKSILSNLGYIKHELVRNATEFIQNVNNECDPESEYAHYHPMLKGEVSIEIHTKLQNTSENYQQNLNEIWANAKVVTINGLPAMALDNYNLLIHLCLHLHKHFTVLEHVQFTGFVDITNILSEIDKSFEFRVSSSGLKEKDIRFVETRHATSVQVKMGLAGFVWEEFIAKCKTYKCEEPVFKYLLLCREYFNAPLPDYLYEAYKHTFTDRDRDLFMKHLTGYDFAADRDNSAVPVHFRNIRHIKNPLLKLRYLVEVVFPPKTFMVEKYDPQPLPIKESGQVAGSKSKKGSPLGVRGKLWWLWYPYRWLMGLKGFWLVITKNTVEKKGK